MDKVVLRFPAVHSDSDMTFISRILPAPSQKDRLKPALHTVRSAGFSLFCGAAVSPPDGYFAARYFGGFLSKTNLWTLLMRPVGSISRTRRTAESRRKIGPVYLGEVRMGSVPSSVQWISEFLRAGMISTSRSVVKTDRPLTSRRSGSR